jgi:sensor histidine kinase YesM
MKIEWIIIETIAVFVDALVKVYFLNSRFASKFESIIPQLLAWLCFFGWGVAGTFLHFPIWLYDGFMCVIILSYLLLAKYGTLGQKLFGLVLTEALVYGSSLAGAGLASLFTYVNIAHTQVHQDNARLLTIVLIKTIQIILFYMLAKKHFRFRELKKAPVIMLTCAAILLFFCLLFMFFNLSVFDEQANHLLIGLSAGLLFILIVMFAMYEIFVREESRNIELSTSLQRLEMESHFFKELDAMQADLRIWRHEYKNNLVALRAIIKDSSSEKSLEYLDKISGDPLRESAMLQTGNTVLDAVVSSKLLLACSRGIKVNIQAVYPELNNIEDNDLCAIAGNLLDNAIEACERMSNGTQTRFISFSLLAKGKNLVLSILNSYEGEIKRVGKVFLTAKNNPLHGIGIKYVDSIVEKYQGHVLREYQNGMFETHVMFPLIAEQGGEGQ